MAVHGGAPSRARPAAARLAARTSPQQAAIAATHAAASDLAHTDWVRIVSLYDQLHRLAPSPVVQLNRAVAVAQW